MAGVEADTQVAAEHLLRADQLELAGIGAVSMMIGSPPASTAVWIRAIGVRPSSAAFSLVVISSAADPSEICEELPAVMKLVDETEQQLSGKGRVLLRYSGTEPKIRLLIEGREPDEIDRQANRIAEAIAEAIGA